MPTKKDLAALLSETPQPPLRRGRGLRLSRASQQTPNAPVEADASPVPSSRVDAPPSEEDPEVDASVEAPGEPTTAAPDSSATAAQQVETAAASDVVSPEPARDRRKIKLRKDLLKECKRLAHAQDRKLYQVIESALEDYVQRHGARE
ncbi:MAG TPA: hypothetical protein VKE41_24500 [Roseiflexaceae bacterium]|nr:hypothetical protein [Roseiflexaceae bacterium]